MGISVAIMVPHPPLIIPDVGKGEEKKIKNTIEAYHAAAQFLGQHKPETIVLLSPHQTMYANYFHISPGSGAKGDFSQFGAGQVKLEVSYDTQFVDALCRLAEERGIPAGTQGERDKRLDHGTMVPLYFINQYWTDYRLVRMGLSGMPLALHYKLGQCVKEIAEKADGSVAIVASGDLSHRLKAEGPYGFQKEGPQYDKRIMDVMGRAAFGELLDFPESFCEKAGECGHRAFTIMAGALDQTAVEAKELSHEGPFGVGYGVCTYEVKGAEPKRNFKEIYEQKIKQGLQEKKTKEDAYVQLARQTVETYTLTGEKPEMPDFLPREMYETRAGVFVSIKEDGMLRGCIGTIQAVQDSIAEEIMENAISAACRDPRFSAIRADELSRLSISVDVLGDAEPVSSLDELDAKRYGVIVTKGFKRGLLLPNLDGVDTVQEQISIAKQKAGIGEREKVKLERFEVVRHY